MLNDEFTSGGAVTLNPTLMLSRTGVEIAEKVAKVRPGCGLGQCATGVNVLMAKLGDLFPGLGIRSIMMVSARRGMFQVAEHAQRRVVGSPAEWTAHVAVEIEGGLVDSVARDDFRESSSWKEFIVGIENAAMRSSSSDDFVPGVSSDDGCVLHGWGARRLAILDALSRPDTHGGAPDGRHR